MLDRLTRWWRTEEDVQLLESLSDRMLEDMGIPREEIRPRVRAPAEAQDEEPAGRPGGPLGRLLPQGI